MNDIVITYSKKHNSDNRLKLMIRAIEKHCQGYNEIFIVGDKPEWIQGVIHIDFSDLEDRKFYHKHNYLKLKSVCLNSMLTSNFIWIDADGLVPYFDARKPIRISIPTIDVNFHKPKGYDKIALTHTNKLMNRRGFRDINFFNLFPLSMSKERVMNTFYDIDFETTFGYCIKTLYCNFNRLNPTSGYIPSLNLIECENKSTYEK